MIDSKLDFIYNKKYLVVVPAMSKNLLESISYSFGNTIFMNNDVDSINMMIKFINQSNFKKIVFVDYQSEFEQVINGLTNEHEIKFLFTQSLGALSDSFIYYTFNNIYKLYNNKVIHEIGCVDRGLYESLKHKGDNVSFVSLDIEKTKNKKIIVDNCNIGLLNSECDAKHSFYNELSAIKLIDGYKAKVLRPNKITKDFIKLFNIDSCFVTKEDKFLSDNVVNLYVNFTGNDYTLFLKSMDLGIPCIVGNNELIDNDELMNYLMIKSDDDINEISEKIESVIKNKKMILKLYEKFRTEYTKKSSDSIEKFLGCSRDKIVLNDETDILISIIVPVYNVEKYLAHSLDSILNSVVDKTEILLINDGSTDKSEEIALRYVKQYPNLIRYIKQENHGLGNVRNVGLKEAKGKYIASIDSDDTISPHFFTEALDALENDVDVVVYDWLTISNTGKFDTPAIDQIFSNENKYEGILYTTIMPSTCNKIYKKSLYTDLDIKYIEDKYEDLSANPFVLLKAQSFKYINKSYYGYYIRSNSIMRSSAGFSMVDIIKIVNDRLIKYNDYINVDIDKFKFYTFSWRCEDYIMSQFYDMDDKEVDKFSKYLYDNVKDILVNMFNSEFYVSSLAGIKDDVNREYIIKRNKAFEDGKIAEFIKKANKSKKIYKYGAAMLLYGE